MPPLDALGPRHVYLAGVAATLALVAVEAWYKAREDVRLEREHRERMRWLRLDLDNAGDAALDPGDQHL